jgi:hypothetical protein
MQYLKQKPSSNGGMVGDQQQYFGVRGHGIQPFSDSHYARKPRTSNASSVVDSSATAYQSLVNYNHYQEDESANVESNQDSSKFLSISPSDVLSQFPHMLTLLEQREILEYQNVFYFGQNSIDSSTGRILKRLPSGTEHNNYGQFLHQFTFF